MSPFKKFTTLSVGFMLSMTFSSYCQDTGNPLIDSFDEYSRLRSDSPYGLEWVQVGPVMNSARVEAVQGVAGKPGLIYVAFGSGNLWKTENNGLSWKPIFENQPVLGIGDIAVSPSDPETIWLGSGESLKKARNFTMPGAGVFRSTNGGDTWEYKGLPDSYHIGEIAVNPYNADIAFVAVLGHFWSTNANRGLYRTLDGGNTWEHVLYINERTGANDVVISPVDPNIIFASVWENNPGISGAGSGIYKSSDGGTTWTRLGGGLPDGENTGRIGLAMSAQDPERVYCLVDNLNRDKNLAAEVYRSDDGGTTWKRTHEKDLLIFPGIGWYFADIYLNPLNDDEVYALGVRMAKSTDGGRTFSNVGGTVVHLNSSTATPLHLDMCELWIDPTDTSRLLLGNDGGLYQSWDEGNSWLHHNNIPAGEFYDISVDNQDPYLIYGGVQDDASVFGPSKEWNPDLPDGWKYVWLDAWAGGDGCFTFPDPGDPNTVYFSSQNGAAKRKDMNAGKSVSIKPRLPRSNKGNQVYAFVAPYFCSPHNSSTLYHAGNYVFKSVDRGDNWKLVSPDLSASKRKENRSTTIGAMMESPLKQGLLYAGTDAGIFWTSMDDGVSWVESEFEFPEYYFRSTLPSKYSESRVYAAITGINNDDFGNYLYVSEDYGRNWRSISSNLPEEIANVIIEDPVYENVLYAGLYRGVYISIDRGSSWALLGPLLPPCAISDLVIQERELDLVAGTHGRGIYRMSLKPLHEALSIGWPERDNRLFEIPSARLPARNDTNRDIDPATMSKVNITFELMEEGEVKIELIRSGNVLWSKSMDCKKGFNQYRWDLVLEESDDQGPYFIEYKKFPLPGKYIIRVTGDGFEMEKEMIVVMNDER